MAEIILAAEVGRPSGSSSARRLRHDGQHPGRGLRPRASTPSRSRSSARELRTALSTDAGLNAVLSLAGRRQELPHHGPRAAAPPRARQRDARRLPGRRPQPRGHRRRDRSPSPVRRSRCTGPTACSSSRCSRSPSSPGPPTSPPISRSTSATSSSAPPSGCRTSRCPPTSSPRSTPSRSSPPASRRVSRPPKRARREGEGAEGEGAEGEAGAAGRDASAEAGGESGGES